jgi:hypothetical protein
MLGQTNDTDRVVWRQFRRWRDDRAWKTLTDRIRAYAQENNRTILISGNSLAKYVDLQVLGVWGAWTTSNGHIDLSGSQLSDWRSLVQRGRILAGKRVPVTLDRLDAYSVVTLHYEAVPDLFRLRDPARTPTAHLWERAVINEFRVRADGQIEDADELVGYLQGNLHPQLRNPPTFLVNAANPGTLVVHVRGVATLGARLEYRVDGTTKQVIKLPDRDHRNDAHAPEYDQDFRFAIPAGAHRLTLDNTGGDWAFVTWLAFE